MQYSCIKIESIKSNIQEEAFGDWLHVFTQRDNMARNHAPQEKKAKKTGQAHSYLATLRKNKHLKDSRVFSWFFFHFYIYMFVDVDEMSEYDGKMKNW